MHHYTSIAEQFIPQGKVIEVREFGNGNINDTYLVTNVYFKVKHPEHNLLRALVQFRLTESIEAHEGDIRNIIQNMDAGAA